MREKNRHITPAEWRDGEKAFRALRATRSARELALALGVTKSAVCHWDAGRSFPMLRSLQKIMQAYEAQAKREGLREIRGNAP
jgi:transcriptional regulator with XRE-family HTH domain